MIFFLENLNFKPEMFVFFYTRFTQSFPFKKTKKEEKKKKEKVRSFFINYHVGQICPVLEKGQENGKGEREWDEEEREKSWIGKRIKSVSEWRGGHRMESSNIFTVKRIKNSRRRRRHRRRSRGSRIIQKL